MVRLNGAQPRLDKQGSYLVRLDNSFTMNEVSTFVKLHHGKGLEGSCEAGQGKGEKEGVTKEG